MKFSINSGDLLRRLQTLAKAQASKSPLPILETFKLYLSDGILTITAGSQEQTLVTKLPVSDAEDQNQSICINALRTLSALKELPNQPIVFAANDQDYQITVDYQGGQFHFVGEDASVYPELINITTQEQGFSLPTETLRSALAATISCIGDDELRPQMTGVFFDFHDGILSCVSSDGHRLCRINFSNYPVEQPFSFTLPFRSANLLRQFIEKGDETVRFTIGSQKVIIETTNYTLYATLIEGRFPNYNAVIPKDNNLVATIDHDTFMSALRRVMVFSNSASSLISLHFDNNALVLEAKDLDFNCNSEEVVPCEYDKSPVTIGFSSIILLNILQQLPSVELEIRLADPSRAGLILPAQQAEGEELLYLLLPMMLQ